MTPIFPLLALTHSRRSKSLNKGPFYRNFHWKLSIKKNLFKKTPKISIWP